MSFRTWRFRRIVGVAILWMLLLLVVSIGRATISTPQATTPSMEELYVTVRLVGGPWLLLGPPALLAGTWWATRRLRRPAS